MALELYVLLTARGDRHGPAFANADLSPSSAEFALDRAVLPLGDAGRLDTRAAQIAFSRRSAAISSAP